MEKTITIEDFGQLTVTVKTNEDFGDTCKLCNYSKNHPDKYDRRICNYCLDNFSDDKYLT